MEYLNRTSKVRLLRVNTGRVHSGSRKPRLEVQGCGSIWPQVSVCSNCSQVQWCWKAGQSIQASQGNRPDYQSLPATHQGFYPGMSLTFGATFFFCLEVAVTMLCLGDSEQPSWPLPTGRQEQLHYQRRRPAMSPNCPVPHGEAAQSSSCGE